MAVGGAQPLSPPRLGTGCSRVGAWRDCAREVRAGETAARPDMIQPRGAVSQKPSWLPPRFLGSQGPPRPPRCP